MSKYIAETVSEIIEGLGYNHFIRHFEIIDGKHRQNIKGKPFADYAAESEFIERELEAWPKNSIEYQMIQSRLNILKDPCRQVDTSTQLDKPPNSSLKAVV